MCMLFVYMCVCRLFICVWRHIHRVISHHICVCIHIHTYNMWTWCTYIAIHYKGWEEEIREAMYRYFLEHVIHHNFVVLLGLPYKYMIPFRIVGWLTFSALCTFHNPLCHWTGLNHLVLLSLYLPQKLVFNF